MGYKSLKKGRRCLICRASSCVMSRLRLWSDKVAQPHRQLKGPSVWTKYRGKEVPTDDLITGTTDVLRTVQRS